MQAQRILPYTRTCGGKPGKAAQAQRQRQPQQDGKLPPAPAPHAGKASAQRCAQCLAFFK